MMILLGLPIAGILLAALCALARRGMRFAWLACISVCAAGLVLAAAVDHSPSETSNVAFAIGATLGLLIATAIVLHGSHRLGRRAAFVFATLIGGLGWIPGYALGCVVVEWLPVNRCFF